MDKEKGYVCLVIRDSLHILTETSMGHMLLITCNLRRMPSKEDVLYGPRRGRGGGRKRWQLIPSSSEAKAYLVHGRC